MAKLKLINKRARIPLSLLVGRYFLYVLLGALLAASVPAGVLTWQLHSGIVLPANYGEVHLEEIAAALQAQDSFNPDAIPAAYRFAVFDSQGKLITGDMEGSQAEVAHRISEGENQESLLGPDGATYFYSIAMSGGNKCVLGYELLPQWADKSLRDSLLNPQHLMLWTIIICLTLTVVLTALRAGHVLKRKMGSLLLAADAVGKQDFDSPLSSSNVIEINEVLQAMEEMRRSLQRSLQARQELEKQSREQVAALAHDLKTPLTVARGNAELLMEDALEGKLGQTQAESVKAIHAAALSMDDFVISIVEATRGTSQELDFQQVDLAVFAENLVAAARRLALAREINLQVRGKPEAQRAWEFYLENGGAQPPWDQTALERATLNLVNNACDHTSKGAVTMEFSFDAGEKSFSISVSDDGPGFSPEALQHGTERFYRESVSAYSNSSGSHFGLGLSIAADIAAAHGGALKLSNMASESGQIFGARAVIDLPLS